MLVQAPAGLQGDPQAYAAWLESLRPKYGGWTGIFDTLGLFSIFNSVWFRGITVLLMTSVLACSVNRAPHLWKLTVHPRTDMSESFFDHAPLSMQATGRVRAGGRRRQRRGGLRAPTLPDDRPTTTATRSTSMPTTSAGGPSARSSPTSASSSS